MQLLGKAQLKTAQKFGGDFMTKETQDKFAGGEIDFGDQLKLQMAARKKQLNLD